jgi:hypothetical protein
MAQQKGIIPLKGTMGNITFYKSKEGYMAREKGGVQPNALPPIRSFNAPVKMALSLAGQAWQVNSSVPH